MRAILEIQSGPEVSRRIAVSADTPRTIGQSMAADERFAHDAWMSPVHAALWVERDALRVRDLDSQYGTLVNGTGVHEATLRHGDTLQIGSTVFVLRLEHVTLARPAHEDASATPTFTRRDEHARWFLQSGATTVYAVLDTARDDQVLPYLLGAAVEYQNLYDGQRGEELIDVAPYLVAFPPDGSALQELLALGWGRSWGVFLTADVPLRDLRRHLRRFLRVKVEGAGVRIFRFYDPRVLRVYLPTCTPEEVAEFFGPITSYMTEGRRGATVMRFTPDASGVLIDTEALVRDDAQTLARAR